MALTSGTKLGPYEIQSPLGAGGMGEVYRARDQRLDRSVAIKIISLDLAHHPGLRERFEKEARTLSSISHPHICSVFDVGQLEGLDYLVLEYLEGETLADRLGKGALPIEQVLRYGMEIAQALEAAHEHGIVHRDLKPANIMLTKSGVKLMDFGLAKEGAGGETSPMRAVTATEELSVMATKSRPLTAEGTIIGTYQYMAPEQLEGKAATARSDIFALGAVLYEMASGRRAFSGKTQASLIAAVLTSEPAPVSSVNPLTPLALERLIRSCMAKDPEERWQSAHDIRLQLKTIAEGGSQAGAVALPKRSKKQQMIRAAAGIAAAAAIIFVFLYFERPAQQTPVIRSFITAPENVSFVFVGDAGGPPVLSPDGRNLAFVAGETTGTPQIYVRALGSLDAVPLAGTENAWAPFWSPDGRKIGFFAQAKLRVIDIQGGTPISIADAPNGRGGSWSRDGMIVFAPEFRSALYRVPASGGAAVVVTHVDESKHTSHRWPYFLPDGKHFLYLAVNHQAPRDENDGIYYASVDGKENIRLRAGFSNPQYAAGSLLYVRDSELVAQALDASTGKLSEEEQHVANGVTADDTTWRAVFTVSANGLLAYAGGAHLQSQLGWYDRNGRQVGTVGERFGDLAIGDEELRLSPSGDRVALAIQSTTTDIWIMDVARGVRARLTFGPTGNNSPVWSPDGKWIAYQTITKKGNAIMRKPALGGAEELLVSAPIPIYAHDWSADGKYLLYQAGAPGTGQEIWALPLAGERKPLLLVSSETGSTNQVPQLSRDDRWLAYQSTESGRMEVYIVPFRGGGGKWQVSTSGGSAPRWRNDGKELFYIGLNGTLMAVPVQAEGGQLKLGAPQPLFRSNTIQYDVAAGGQKFLLDVVGEQGSKPITLVTNWTAELKK